ncbi:MAG: class I SAM-dependent methyltransferase [Candidatus Stygibacter frigidus]|nr:class I SAM-dependent methyltransferase [Candidatus Stygibacter frigidus]
MQKQAYSLFARYYDEYMAHVEYDKWVDFILGSYTRRYKKSPDKILELACGTGNIASRLVRRGCKKVDATDISDAMLDIAKSKPFPANYQIADMLVPIIDKYDLIILLFDSLNYLINDIDISILLNNVRNSLSNKGLFIFDISTIRNCQENFDGFINIEDEERGFVIHESEFDNSKLMQTNHITFFVPEGDFFKRYDENHQQKIYRVEAIVELIKASALKLYGIYCLTDSEPKLITTTDYAFADKHYSRVFFVLGLDNA